MLHFWNGPYILATFSQDFPSSLENSTVTIGPNSDSAISVFQLTSKESPPLTLSSSFGLRIVTPLSGRLDEQLKQTMKRNDKKNDKMSFFPIGLSFLQFFR